MKELLIVVGIASMGYGMYLLHAKKTMGQRSRTRGSTARTPGSIPAAVTTDPTVTSSAGPVNNTISPVEHFDAGYGAKFPPITYIAIPGAGSLDNMNTTNMHAVVQF